ncbi:MAG: hypothetical protein NZ954_03540 [Thermofilaceae archaeon]|nr:hypothetical protein [Thermofilaceae archaeon]MCX8181128.1 hypothetical protein [Thermofilaceae archaeon]MDW8004866.1 hypothetical protein [Thermofilaceae archaeon]
MNFYEKTLFFLFAALVGATVALAQPRLTVATDSSFYEPGSKVTVRISGPPQAPLGLEVRGPKGELVVLRQLTLDARGVAIFAFTLDPQCREGIYTIYVATPGAAASTTFEVVTRPSPIILIAPPGQALIGKQVNVLCFIYPGLQVKVSAYSRQHGGDWMPLGEYESNSSGWLIIYLTPASEGTYELKVEFPGTHEYGPASAIARFKAVKTAPDWKVEAPPVKWLGETLTITCEGYDAVIARTIAGEKTFKCGAKVKLDTPGPWLFYPAKGDTMGTPSIMMVKAKLNTTVKAPTEVGVNEPFSLVASFTPPAPAVRVNFVDAEGTVLATTFSKVNGTAFARASIRKAGEYTVKAIPLPTSVFEMGESTPATIRVLGEKLHVQLVVLDAAGRRLYNSVVEVSGARFDAPMGVTDFTVRVGVYDVKVYWRGLLVYASRLTLEEHNVTIKVPLYDLKITVVDFLGRPAVGELVELYNNTERLAVGSAGENGQLTFIRVPVGAYTVKAGDASKTISVPEDSEVKLVLPPPSWLIILVVFVIVLVIIILTARLHAKVTIRRIKS